MYGGSGAAGQYFVERADGCVETLDAKQAKVKLFAGEVFVMRTSGGGGLGPPTIRDPELVCDDVRGQRVTREAAASVYGVVLRVDGEIDDLATARRRDALAKSPGAGA